MATDICIIYTYMHIPLYIYIYIYTYIEREREREKDNIITIKQESHPEEPRAERELLQKRLDDNGLARRPTRSTLNCMILYNIILYKVMRLLYMLSVITIVTIVIHPLLVREPRLSGPSVSARLAGRAKVCVSSGCLGVRTCDLFDIL